MEVEKSEKWILAEAIHSMFQAPLYHLMLEGLLVIWIIRLIFSKSYKLRDKVPLTEKEKDELIEEWIPEPLVPSLEITRSKATPYRLVTGPPGKTIVIDNKECLNLSSMNFLGFLGNKRINEQASNCISKYGVGSCGPRAFYGTVDVHVELEDRIAKYMKSERALTYSYGFATIASAIPAYAKRGDIIFVDEAVYFAIQKGLHASRSKIITYKHNDLVDLENKLIAQEMLDKKDPKKASVTRKFMVVEGIFMNTGQICDLPRLVELKYKYKVRLFIDESLSFGVLGENGRGVTEHFNVPIAKVDCICSCMEYSLASVGGFCTGRAYVVDHQTLSGQGYVFSASLPPLLARAAIEALNIIEEDPSIFTRIRSKGAYMQQLLADTPHLKISGYYESPSFHLKKINPGSIQNDTLFLSKIVEQCSDEGVCLTIASRLSHEEMDANWPPSIRMAVSVEMSDEELSDAADIIKKVAAKVGEDMNLKEE